MRVRASQPTWRSLAFASCVVAAVGCTCEQSHSTAGPSTSSRAASTQASEPSWSGLRVRILGDQTRSAAPVVVLLHGWGADGDDLVPLARRLGEGDAMRFVVPRAPLARSGGGRAWWRLDLEKRRAQLAAGNRDLSNEVPEGLPEARDQLLALLGDVQRHLGASPDRIVVGGFSQGAMLAMDVALHSNVQLAGVACMSGTLLAEQEWRRRLAEKRGMPVFLSHGRRDRVLPFRGAQQLRELLQQGGLKVTWLPFDGGHAMPPRVLRELDTFLDEVL